MNDSDTVTPTE